MLLSLSLSLALFHILSNFGCNHHHHYGFFLSDPFSFHNTFSLFISTIANFHLCFACIIIVEINAAPNSQNTHNTNGVTFKLFFFYFCILFICYVSILFPIFFTVIFTTPTPNKFFFLQSVILPNIAIFTFFSLCFCCMYV